MFTHLQTALWGRYYKLGFQSNEQNLNQNKLSRKARSGDLRLIL